MIHPTALFVHLQYDTLGSPQSCSLRALTATVVRTTALSLSLVGAMRMTALTPIVAP
jgi:hypothetical protein